MKGKWRIDDVTNMEEALVHRSFTMKITFDVAESNLNAAEELMPGFRYNPAVKEPLAIYKFKVLPTDFSAAGGELTPSGKMKRAFIEEKYKDEI